MLSQTYYPPTVQEISLTVLSNGGAILDNISTKQIDRYLELQEKLHQTDVSKDPNFQAGFGRLHHFGKRRIKPGIRKRFFQLLENYKGHREFDIRLLSGELLTDKPDFRFKPKHFSVITRLMHTLYEQYPIYDKNVSAFFAFSPPVGKRVSRYRKMNAFEDFYTDLVEIYREILVKNKLYDLIRATEISKGLQKKGISHAKILDLLIRSAGELKRKGELIEPKQLELGTVLQPA